MEFDFESWNEVKYSTSQVDKLLLAYRLGYDFITRIEQCREKLSEIDERHLREIAAYSRKFFEHGQPFNILRENIRIPHISKLIEQSEQMLIALESWTD